MTEFGILVVALIALRCAAQLTLDALNRLHVLAHADGVPEAFRGIVDEPTYAKSVQYTLAKSRLNQVELLYDAGLLLLVLFSGVLPAAYYWWTGLAGTGSWASGGYLWLVGAALALLSVPFEWYAQFRLEARFGFNTSTQRIWWVDRIKGILLALILGYPLLVFIIKLTGWTGAAWWLWAWAALMAFQAIMLVLAPVLIMPLFNKFTPLPQGSLRDRLLTLAERTQFHADNIQVMDGSKRSSHSNAFFTGFGRFRKIVLFDTLIAQLSEPELEAVLAHEIGHYKRKHILRFMLASAGLSLGAFYLLAWLAGQSWFYRTFGFAPGSIVPALLVFALLSGVLTFWLSPLVNIWSRRFEYQADAFAASVMQTGQFLISALRKLNEKNLSNLTPHPVYSGFYYSHPTLLERERALEGARLGAKATI